MEFDTNDITKNIMEIQIHHLYSDQFYFGMDQGLAGTADVGMVCRQVAFLVVLGHTIVIIIVVVDLEIIHVAAVSAVVVLAATQEVVDLAAVPEVEDLEGTPVAVALAGVLEEEVPVVAVFN